MVYYDFSTYFSDFTTFSCFIASLFPCFLTSYGLRTLKFIRALKFIILEWIRRNQNDQKTYGELFFMFCDDIQDMDLTNALQSLMALFVEHILTLSADITSIIKCKVSEWIASQAAFIQALFRDISWES